MGVRPVLGDLGVGPPAASDLAGVATVRAAVFDRLTAEQTRVFGEVCEIIRTGLTGPDRPPLPADLPWRRSPCAGPRLAVERAAVAGVLYGSQVLPTFRIRPR
ncbi:hypothetical protein [Streptomyces griseorubiginosus]|uniref:hypothetical protein n=1 Tax=Streptomyces griseorubiginosus TaxID=67304 RepID=UPI003663A4AB